MDYVIINERWSEFHLPLVLVTSCFLTWKSHSMSLNSHVPKEAHLITWGMHTMFSQWLYFFYIILSFPESWPSLTQACIWEWTLICTQVLLTLCGPCSEPGDTSTSYHAPTQRSGCQTRGPLIQAHWPVTLLQRSEVQLHRVSF